MTPSSYSEHHSAQYSRRSTDIKEVSKCAVRYMKMAECRLGSSAGYICYNCIYSTMPDHCPIITDEGLDS